MRARVEQAGKNQLAEAFKGLGVSKEASNTDQQFTE